MLNTESSLLDSGFEKRKGVISGNTLSELRIISDVIVKVGLMLRIVGLGNRSLRNSTVFTGNLVLKHPLFVSVLQKVAPIAIEELGANCLVSEFKLVSSLNSKNFQMWWHRDFPFRDDIDARIDDKVALGMIIPLCDFNAHVGSTYMLPKSHKLTKFPADYRNGDFIGDGVQLESAMGDVWIYDPRTVHSGAQNHSSKLRHIILIEFILPEFSARENFKYQVERLPYVSEFLEEAKHLWGTHEPDLSRFGSNRGWEHTSYRFFFSSISILNIKIQKLFLRAKLVLLRMFINFKYSRNDD
jgi:hypothetical protein